MGKKSMNLGADIDNLRQTIRAAIQACERREQALQKLGCLKAHIHFKTGTNVMFMNKPVDPVTGKRPYVHVGVDPRKQAEARALVYREQVRERLAALREALAQSLQGMDEELQWLANRYRRLADEIPNLENVINAPDEPQN